MYSPVPVVGDISLIPPVVPPMNGFTTAVIPDTSDDVTVVNDSHVIRPDNLAQMQSSGPHSNDQQTEQTSMTD
jgi:hypothetical protein